MFMGIAVGCGSGDRELVFIWFGRRRSSSHGIFVTRRVARVFCRARMLSRVFFWSGVSMVVASLLLVFVNIFLRFLDDNILYTVLFSGLFVIIWGRDLWVGVFYVFYLERPISRHILRTVAASAPAVLLFSLLSIALYPGLAAVAYILALTAAVILALTAYEVMSILRIDKMMSEDRYVFVQCPDEEKAEIFLIYNRVKDPCKIIRQQPSL